MLKRLVWTVAVVAAVAMAVFFVLVGLDTSDKVAGPISAMSGVLALAAGLVATSKASRRRTITVKGTGKVGGGKYRAITGLDAPAEHLKDTDLVVEETGDIDGGGGEGITGARLS
ncbi:hypothetical protein [Verrucosispora sp. WMMD1129]|uniref:hypothetical protein n=1 Tax=Verrucosispora sp. WMMD1129 TaxID=3016093 RepID=UPI00249B40D4|nr:hypothetical protein [Verrucosispora sp. WMMD1129]WFE47718.1 hypothetical protein O7624_27000 [Verrucosispora sp. WMMD1129]